jgi:hypothetical protein
MEHKKRILADTNDFSPSSENEAEAEEQEFHWVTLTDEDWNEACTTLSEKLQMVLLS